MLVLHSRVETNCSGRRPDFEDQTLPTGLTVEYNSGRFMAPDTERVWLYCVAVRAFHTVTNPGGPSGTRTLTRHLKRVPLLPVEPKALDLDGPG